MTSTLGRDLIRQMRATAPPGQQLGDATYRRLQALTGQLTGARHDQAIAEHERFLSIAERELCLPEAELKARIEHATILVTGGTGCVGSRLIRHLASRRSGLGCLVSVSRGTATSYPRHPDAKYRYADVRDREALDELIGDIRPDLIFHLAAQRDPGLAEIEVHRTVSTNVLGTRNVLEAAEAAGVRQVVCASTGKALRPYSPDIYTASKRAAEWISATAAARSGMLVSAGRFTHVLDNSIIYQRLRCWAADGDPIRLHSPDIAFYVQSARESAHLLLLAALCARAGEYRIAAISDLGWPASLLDLAVAVLAESGSRAPVYFSGYDAGYEEVPFPGLYDPATAGDVSPLLNAFEASAVTGSPCPRVDVFRADMAPEPQPVKLLSALSDVCRQTRDPGIIRGALDELSWAVLGAALRLAPQPALARMAALTRRAPGLSADHDRILRRIEDALDAVPA